MHYQEVTGPYAIHYGWYDAVGPFVLVYDHDFEEPEVDLDARWDGIGVADVIAIARRYGAVKVEARMMAAPAALRLGQREESVK